MFSLLLEYPIVTGITIALSLIFVTVISRVDPRLGEIISSGTVFPLVELGVLAILWTVLAIRKALLPGEVKKKNRARALKSRNSKE